MKISSGGRVVGVGADASASSGVAGGGGGGGAGGADDNSGCRQRPVLLSSYPSLTKAEGSCCHLCLPFDF